MRHLCRRGLWCAVAVAWLMAVYGCGESDPSLGGGSSSSGVYVYWDTNEEEDVLLPSGQVTKLVQPYDPNGQMCIVPDGSGRFVTGYNPTLPDQHNPGSLKPYKNPPVGESLWDRHGNFLRTIYVPGPYGLPGSDIGGDIPPDTASTFCTDGTTTGHCTGDADCSPRGRCSGTFNDNGTFTGCAFDSKGNLFAADIGQAQGSNASPDQGRIIEWFPPDYNSFCIIIGPTQGGDPGTPHHVNGTGGLKNPGLMAVDSDDNLYVPESGALRVLKFDHATLPQSAADCGGDGLLTPAAPHEIFIRPGGAPGGIAWDPTCNCWAVSNVGAGIPLFGTAPAISWFDTTGHATNVKGPVPVVPVGQPNSFTPFGIGVSPTGDVFFVDIHLHCDANGCGPTDPLGGVFKVTFNGGVPSMPQRIVGGLYFPVSVTVCDSSKQVCPEPAP